MKIVGPVGLLVLVFDPATVSFRLSIVRDLPHALPTWKPSTRVSPLFGLAEDGQEVQAAPEHFGGEHYAALIGPVNPSLLPDLQNVRIWLTLGALNVFVVSQDAAVTDDISDWAAAHSIAFEQWRIRDGIVEAYRYSQATTATLDVEFRRIGLLSARAVPGDLAPALSEYCALMASALARSAATVPEMVGDLLAVQQFVEQAISQPHLDSHTVLYRTIGVLSQLNGGVSRFSAQALSGTSPVFATECHFWIHSLLGTGIANLALHKTANFVSGKLETKRISARVAHLGGRRDSAPDLRTVAADFWHQNHLAAVEPPEPGPDEGSVPLLTHYSGRDGFRSGLNTVSAPLVAICACNCRQWSLSTITHEISHVLIRGILASVFPNPATTNGTAVVQAFLRNDPRATWLESLQFHLIESAIAMHQTAERIAEKDPTTRWTEKRIAALLDVWHHEIEEIMVHAFDFLYFHGQQSGRYVSSIWTTWGVIPTIGSRVEEYLIRTLCTVYVRHLRRQEAFEVTRDEVSETLATLKNAEAGPHVAAALALLRDEREWPRLRSTVVARADLVKLVRGFLYWDEAAQDVRGDRALTSDASDRGGYAFRIREIGQGEIDNPLRFVEEYTDSTVPSSATSAWMLYALAFWTTRGGDAR